MPAVAQARRFLLSVVCVGVAIGAAGCGGGHHASAHGYHTRYGISPHHPGFATLPPPRGFAFGIAPQPTLEMFDSIEYNVPSGAQAVAGYTAGYWPTWLNFTRIFPGLNRQGRVVSIAIGWGYRAQCLDDEPGDATPGQVVPWVRAEIAAGNSRPCVYASVSQMFSDIVPRLANAGLSGTVRRWCAWYRYRPGLIAGCDGVQWTDHALGRNLDESTVALSFFGATPTPPKPKPDKYAILPAGYIRIGHGRLSERATVKAFDARGCTKRPRRDATCGHFRRELVVLEDRIRTVARHDGWKVNHRLTRVQIMRRRSG